MRLKLFICGLVSFLLLFKSPGLAQHFDPGQLPKIGVVTGTVIDSVTGIPIAYASVSLEDIRDQTVVTGGITDDQGHFRIEEIRLGRYSVIVDFIGYEKTVIHGISLFPGKGGGVEQNLGIIKLVSVSLQMEELEVLGESPQLIQTIDKKIFRVDKSLTVAGGTAADALKKIPSVDVDIDGNISLRGDQNVTVLVDGKPSGLTHGDRRAVVDNIPAAMIDRVEVITNPSAKYDPDGMGGIINIILKRGKFEGLNGMTSASVGQFEKYNFSGALNYRVNSWNVFTNGSYRLGNQLGKGGREFIWVYPTSTDSSRMATKRLRIPETVSLKIGGDYYLNKRNTISISGSFNNHTNQTDDYLNYFLPYEYTLHSVETDVGQTTQLDFSYDRDFDDEQQDLIFEVSLSKSEDQQKEAHTVENLGVSPGQTSLISDNDTHEDETNSNLILKSDYTQPLGKNSIFEAGYKSTFQRFITELEYLTTPYDYHYNEDVHAIYGTISINITNKMGLKAGARMEQVFTRAEVKSGGIAAETSNIYTTIIDSAISRAPFRNDYFQIYPSFYWLYHLSESKQLQLGYSKRVNRPRRHSLNPFPRNTFDEYHIRNGNPFLKPEYSDVIELNFSNNSRRFTINTGLYYKHVTDMIRWWDNDLVLVVDQGDSLQYQISTADNAGYSNSYGVDLMLNFRPIPFINLMVTLTSWNSRTYGSGESDLNGNFKGLFSYGLASAVLPGVGRLELTGRYRGRMKIINGIIPPVMFLDLALQKNFFNRKFALTLKISDLLDNAGFSIELEEELEDLVTNETYIQYLNADRRRDRRTVFLVLTYNFGNMEQKRRWKQGDREGGGMMDMDY